MRLINGDALHIAIAIYIAENSYINDTALDVLKMIAGWVEETRTIEAEPVRLATYDASGDCTNCGYPMPIEDKRDVILPGEVKYCYRCGAKMGGG